MCPRSAPNGDSDRSTTGQSHGWRASRPVGRVLCTRVSGPTAIHLGLPLPAASCGLPASIGRAALERSRREPWFPSWPCSGWGLPSRRSHLRRWWSLTPPFHPYLRASAGAVCFLWHCPAGHPGSALPTTLPCGARTFLTGPERPGATARPTHPRSGYADGGLGRGPAPYPVARRVRCAGVTALVTGPQRA